MKIAVLNSTLATSGLIEHLLHVGHTVHMYILNTEMNVSDGMGLISRYEQANFEVANEGQFYGEEHNMPRRLIECLEEHEYLEYDFFFVDCARVSQLPLTVCTWLRANCAVPVIGPTAEAYELEEDRQLAKHLVSGFNWADVPFASVLDAVDAYDFIEAQDSESNYLVKGLNTTVMPLNREDLMHLLAQPNANSLLGCPMFLERQITEPHVEIAFTAFVRNDGQLQPYAVVNKEYKGVFDGTQGNLFCGEAGSVLEFAKLADLPPIIVAALRQGAAHAKHFAGSLDVNTMYLTESKTFHFLEFTPRSGVPTETLIATMMGGQVYADHLYALAYSEDFNLPKHTAKRLISVAMTNHLTWDLEDYSPMVHGINQNTDDILGPPNLLASSANPCYSFTPINGQFIEHEIQASAIIPDRVGTINRAIYDMKGTYAELAADFHRMASTVNAFGYYKRTDIALDLDVVSLTELYTQS